MGGSAGSSSLAGSGLALNAMPEFDFSSFSMPAFSFGATQASTDSASASAAVAVNVLAPRTKRKVNPNSADSASLQIATTSAGDLAAPAAGTGGPTLSSDSTVSMDVLGTTNEKAALIESAQEHDVKRAKTIA